MKKLILLGVVLIAAFNAWGYSDEGIVNRDGIKIVQGYEDYTLVEEGLFCVTERFTAVADSDSVEVVIKVPTALAKGAQFWIRYWSDKTTICALADSFAYSDSGTVLTGVNLSNYQGDDATVEISHTPTDTDAGTVWWEASATASEWTTLPPVVLDAVADSIAWCLDIENNGSGDAVVSVEIIWQEEQ